MPNELKCGITFVFLALLAFAVCFFPMPSRKKVRPLGRDKELLELSSGPPHFSCRFPYRRKSLNQIRFGGVGRLLGRFGIWGAAVLEPNPRQEFGFCARLYHVGCRISVEEPNKVIAGHFQQGRCRYPGSIQASERSVRVRRIPPKIRHLHAPWVVHHIMDDRPWRTASRYGENNQRGRERERVRFTHSLTAHTNHSL